MTRAFCRFGKYNWPAARDPRLCTCYLGTCNLSRDLRLVRALFFLIRRAVQTSFTMPSLNWFFFLPVVCIVVFQLLHSALLEFFLVPPHNWKDKIQFVLDYDRPIYLKVGKKISSYRKRLVLASLVPSYYTNYGINGGKLKIFPGDIEELERLMTEFKRRDVTDPKRRILYGFFHPYANNGGGGEKVLWEAIRATLLHSDKNIAIVYTVNNDASPAEILEKTRAKFQIKVDPDRVVFIYLNRFAKLIDASYWSHFTLIGQMIGAALLTLEALYQLAPDVWIDTIGLPGSYLVINLVLKIPIAAYVHYPIIQPDMFSKLDKSTFGKIKKVYWNFMLYFYRFLGCLCTLVMANGTWTFNHLIKVFLWTSQIAIVYPPCGTTELAKDVDNSQRANKMIYIAQFRPEKRHDLVLTQYAKFLEEFKGNGKIKDCPTLVFLGSCRTKDDTKTLESLRELVTSLNLSEFVEFVVDCPYLTILSWLNKCKYGINAMWNEHFGIGVVEYMARGVIPIVHASAGPFLDIAVPVNDQPTGFFFKDELDPDYVESDYKSLSELLEELFITLPIPDAVDQEMRRAGIALVKEKFSNEVFTKKWMAYLTLLEQSEIDMREKLRTNVTRVF